LKREELTKIVKSELEHIPKGDKGSPQSALRRLYNARRRYDLTKTEKMKEDTLQHCIQALKKDHPDFIPKYDEEFFKMPKTPKKGLIQRLFSRTKG